MTSASAFSVGCSHSLHGDYRALRMARRFAVDIEIEAVGASLR
jgi:hypothetical protein